MGIRMHHRRKAIARFPTAPRAWEVPPLATATADTQADRAAGDEAVARRPLPALAPGAATPRIPGTPRTALRSAAARLRRPGLLRLVPRGDLWRLSAEQSRGCLALALGALRGGLGALGRLRRPRLSRRRIAVFVVTPVTPVTPAPLTERPDRSARR